MIGLIIYYLIAKNIYIHKKIRHYESIVFKIFVVNVIV